METFEKQKKMYIEQANILRFFMNKNNMNKPK